MLFIDFRKISHNVTMISGIVLSEGASGSEEEENVALHNLCFVQFPFDRASWDIC